MVEGFQHANRPRMPPSPSPVWIYITLDESGEVYSIAIPETPILGSPSVSGVQLSVAVPGLQAPPALVVRHSPPAGVPA
jgi:hypothetical protein